MADFAPALIEFEAQAAVLINLVELVEITSRGRFVDSEGIHVLPSLSASGQNTMAAAAIVLLAAHFEEYIRQQVQEYAQALALEYENLPENQLEKLIDSYWRGGTNKLGRIRPKGDPLWISGAETQLRSLISFPIEKELSSFLAAYVSEHENNMRWDTITELAGRVGVSKLGQLMFAHLGLRAHVGIEKGGDFPLELQRKLNEFYVLRNGLVHSIAQNNGVGKTILVQWVTFFLIFANAFNATLIASCTKFHEDIQLRKQRKAARA
jgi:hypothetical protein